MARRPPPNGRLLLWIVWLGAGVAWAAGEAPHPAQFDYIREYLREYSVVSEGLASGPRETFSTWLQAHPERDRAVLGYQRSTYSGPESGSLQTQQIIQYTIRFSDIAAHSIETQSHDGFIAGEPYWLVRAVITEGADFVPYTNVFERRAADGSVEVTSSRGRVREIVLGYFAEEVMAERLADHFRDMVENLGGE